MDNFILMLLLISFAKNTTTNNVNVTNTTNCLEGSVKCNYNSQCCSGKCIFWCKYKEEPKILVRDFLKDDDD